MRGSGVPSLMGFLELQLGQGIQARTRSNSIEARTRSIEDLGPFLNGLRNQGALVLGGLALDFFVHQYAHRDFPFNLFT
jgi:hypothetical protein